MSQSVKDLFENAQDEGILSPESVDALNVVDIGDQIQAGLGGVEIDETQSSDVVLVAMLIDDSSSMLDELGSGVKKEDAAIEGHNMVLEALRDSKQKDGIFVHNRYLHGTVLYPYCTLDNVVEMDDNNYSPGGGTPLYEQSIVLLGTVLAECQRWSDNGVPARAITLIASDGEATDWKTKASDVATIVKDMLATGQHIIAGMGINDVNGYVDFYEVFQEMGINKEWILTPKSDKKSVRKAFELFSQSAVKVSQSPAHFSSTAVGGGFATNQVDFLDESSVVV